MHFKKIISAAAAITAAGVLTFSALAKSIGTAGVYSADVYWDVQFWGGAADSKGNMNIASVTNAEITGDGIYTASIKFAYPLSYGQYFALGTTFKGKGSGAQSTFADYPNASLEILSVTADGKEVKGSTVPDVNVDGSMRVYVYNPWVEDDLNYADDLDWTQDITSITVKFRITGLDSSAVTASPAVTETPVTSESAEASETTVPDVTETEPPAASESEEAVVTTSPDVTEKPAVSETTVPSVTETESPVTSESEEAIVTTSPDVTEKPAVSETTVPDVTETVSPTPDADTNSVETGNLPLSFTASLLLLSGSAALMTKKKK